MFKDLEELGSGAEGTVYKFSDTVALKVYSSKESEDVAKMLLPLRLRGIVTPDELVYENGLYLGYKMRLVSDIKYLFSIGKKDLLDSLRVIKDDLEVLSEHQITAGDLVPQNSLYSGNQLFFIDTGLYRQTKADVEVVKNINDRSLDRYVSSLMGRATGSLEGRKFIQSLSMKGIDLVEKYMLDTDTLEEFSKRLYSMKRG